MNKMKELRKTYEMKVLEDLVDIDLDMYSGVSLEPSEVEKFEIVVITKQWLTYGYKPNDETMTNIIEYIEEHKEFLSSNINCVMSTDFDTNQDAINFIKDQYSKIACLDSLIRRIMPVVE